MKQKHANRPDWGRILHKRYFQEHLIEDDFEGYITYLLLDAVKEPLIVKYGIDEICIADDGYSWIMLFPTNKLYSLTVMINQEYEVLQYYFDIVKSIEISTEGIPFIEDMYLDYIVLPNGSLIVKDEEELDEAYQTNLISDEEYKGALLEGDRLRNSISNHTNELINGMNRFVDRLRRIREGK